MVNVTYHRDPNAVPESVTNFQARALMRRTFLPDGRSLFTVVDAKLRGDREAAAALPESDPARIAADTVWQAWEQANDYQRHGALMQQLAAQFGYDPAALDAMFREAETIIA